MKQTMCSLMLLTTALMATSCMHEIKVFSDDGPKVTQVRHIKDFEEIEIMGSPTVYYQQGNTYGVKVVGSEDQVDKIVTEKNGQTLVIRNKGKIGVFNIGMSTGALEVYVTSPDLVGIRLSGSGDFISSGRIDTDDMTITLRGSGDIDIRDLICDHCVTEVVGSGDLEISSLETRTSEVTLVGSGDVTLKQKNVQLTDISLRGSGDIAVDFNNGCREVQANLLGSGDVTLKGKVKKFTQQKTGSGDINTNQLKVE